MRSSAVQDRAIPGFGGLPSHYSILPIISLMGSFPLKKQQVIALGKLGWTLRRIEQATGVRRETAGADLKAAGIAIRPPRGWGRHAPAKPANRVATDSEPKPANEVATDFVRVIVEKQAIALPASSISSSACEPFREAIELGLRRGRNAMAIWQDLVNDHGFSGAYNTVKRFVAKLRGSPQPEPVGIILTAPAEEAQVDYGTGPMVRDAQSGKYRRTRLFVLTLGYSRKSVRLLVFRSSTRTWAELHEKAFRRLGGSPRVVVLDNLKEGVVTPDIYDPTLNPLFKDVLAHYGVVAMPCRIQDPDRKGKVESGVGHSQKTPLKGLRFESLDEAQAYLDNWESRWADTRIHGTTKRQVAAMFAEEKPLLLPLPIEPFRYYQHGERTVHLDGCVEVDAAYYSVPPGWIGKLVPVQWDSLHVRILHPNPKTEKERLLREHVRQERGRHRVRPEDNPKKTPFTTVQLLARAARAGSHLGSFCEAIHRHQGEPGIRRILGVLALAKKFGVAAVEDACATALELCIYEYRFIRRFLERRPQLTLRQVDPLIRELTQYRDLINTKIQEQDHERD
jgi:transposase